MRTPCSSVVRVRKEKNRGGGKLRKTTTPTPKFANLCRFKNNTPCALLVKVPLTGGLAVLSGSEPVAGKRGGGGYD